VIIIPAHLMDSFLESISRKPVGISMAGLTLLITKIPALEQGSRFRYGTTCSYTLLAKVRSEAHEDDGEELTFSGAIVSHPDFTV
jgi:hypothetical protein